MKYGMCKNHVELSFNNIINERFPCPIYTKRVSLFKSGNYFFFTRVVLKYKTTGCDIFHLHFSVFTDFRFFIRIETKYIRRVRWYGITSKSVLRRLGEQYTDGLTRPSNINWDVLQQVHLVCDVQTFSLARSRVSYVGTSE